MKKINKIVETIVVFKYLEKRQLLKQYKKSSINLLQGNTKAIGFKLQKPKSEGVWSFRINKQYRAFGFFENDDFVVFKIDNHQR